MRKTLLMMLMLLLPVGPAAAGSYDIFGTGARAIALGGAYTAVSEDAAALYYNVAGLAQIERLHVELSYNFAEPTLTINGREQDIDQHRGTTLGAVISTLIFNHRLSFGLSFFMPDHHMMRFLVLSTNQPHQAFTANANHAFTSLSGVGFEVFNWWLVGVGINLLATEIGGVDFAITETTPSEGSVFSELSPNYGLTAGMLFKPLEMLRIGLGFRDKLEMNFELPNTIEIPPLEIFENNRMAILRESALDLVAESNSMFSPRSFELGVAVDPLEKLMLSANVGYHLWTGMSSDAPIALAFVSGGLADIFPTGQAAAPTDPDLRDTFTYALGVEGRPILNNTYRLDVRGGYKYRPTPVKEQTGLNNYLDADSHIMSTGLGFTAQLPPWLPRSISCDTFFQYHYSPERTFHKDSPNDFVGDITFSQAWWNIGGTLSVRF